MKKIFKLKTFYAGIILSTAIIFVALLNFSRIYISQSEILVIAQSEKAAVNSGQIIENLKIIPLTLSFFEQVAVNGESEIDEFILELPEYKKKKIWNSKLKTKRIGKSGILKITTFGKNRRQTESLNVIVVKELINSVGFYYDIKNDISIRIIEGPITETKSGVPVLALIILSLVGGLILASLSFLVSFRLFKNNKKEPKIWRFNLERQPKKSVTLSDLDSIIAQEEKSWNIWKKPSDSAYDKKASAPDNLPIAVEERKEKLEIFPAQEFSEIQHPTKEATKEEVKERLNKLLSGEM